MRLIPLNQLIVLAGQSLKYCHKLSDVFEQLSLYYIKLYIGITTSMSLTLSICVLFISLMHSVNGVQFLNTTSLSLLSGIAVAGTGGIVIAPLTSIYTSL